jgi:hypothetical protein
MMSFIITTSPIISIMLVACGWVVVDARAQVGGGSQIDDLEAAV